MNEAALILLIDDDPLTLTSLAAVLDVAGYDCHCVRTPEAAVKAAMNLPLDLILCDVNLAGESGLDLCRELRDLPGLEDVPAMFMSSAQMPDIVRRSHEAGGAYYLRKPFDPEVLLELVGKALWMPHLVQSKVAQLRAVHQHSASTPKPNMTAAQLRGMVAPLA
jgi:DNA-binding response OmpR family regulator